MGAVSSMSTAISGLEANGELLTAISDNIVNANTTAFKGSRTEFESLAASGQMHDSNSSGQGVRVVGVTPLFTQGAITRTNRSTDMAISGNGFFVLRGDTGVTYTRDGSFRFDKDGWMTSLGGQRVQAYSVGADGRITGKMTDLRLDFKAVPAKATGKIELFTNLDARLPVGGHLDQTRPEETAHFTSAFQIFDSVGNPHAVNIYYNRVEENGWEWYAMCDGSQMIGGDAGKGVVISQGKLTFDAMGRLQKSEQQKGNTNFKGGALPDQDMFFNFGDPLDEGGTGQVGTTMYGSNSSVFHNSQDGYTAGVLSDTVIDSDGVISGVFSNGENRTLGQLALARFDATERLAKTGQNQFLETPGSGLALIGKPKSNGRGAVQARSLEHSNIDLASEFVDMIRAQRGFQASAKAISSADQMLDEVINLRRA